MSTKKPQQQQKKGEKQAGKGDAKGAGKAKVGAARKAPAAENEDVRRDQKLQAILLADSFTTTFRPITLESPKVLLPLVNVPMIDYTIEFLTQNGIEEIVVFCGWFADKLEAYLKNSRWNNMVSIRCVSSSNCSSAGDALRELDDLNIIRSDPFVLISGDVVANINLKKAIAFHKQKRKEDPNNIMTLALKKVQRSGGSKPLNDDLVVGMNRKSSQIVIFEDNMKRDSVSLPVELMEDATELSFHSDLLDCNVDICSPELLLQFSDNFDYQDIRKDFIRNEVCNHALGKHIFGYVIENEYAARVQDPRTYHLISRDIVTRWTYPLVPDVPLMREGQCIQLKRYVYRDASVKVARTAEVVEEVVIGRGSIVGAFAKISRTIVGEKVNIGANTTIVDAHLWNDVIIGDNVSIDHSIICGGAVIENDCVVPRGCVISFGVRLAAGTRLAPFTRLSRDAQWQAMSEAEKDQEQMQHHSMGADETWKKNLWMTAPQPEDDESDDDIEDEDDEAFTRAVADMMLTALAEGQPADAVAMEIKGFKFAQDKTWADCVKGAVQGLMSFLDSQWINAQTFFKKMREITKRGALAYSLLKAMTHDESDEVELILALEDYFMTEEAQSNLPSGLRFTLQVLYEAKLVSEDGVRAWATLREEEGDTVSPQKFQLFKDPKVQDFLTWLNGESEEDDEDDDDEDEGDDSEDDSEEESDDE